jgi:hypothetical protein
VRRFLDAARHCLAAAGVPTELIVVDDSMRDAEAIRRLCAAAGAIYLRGPRRVGAKRNVGARVARYGVIAFIDSDCIPTPQLLTHHLRAYDAPGRVGAVAGPVVAAPGTSFAARVARYARDVNAPFGWAMRYTQLGWAPTANLSVAAEAFRAAGGFDEHSATVNGGEDVDLGVRMTAAGWRIVGSPAATVQHGGAPDPVQVLLRKALRYGRADAYLRERHPQRHRWHVNRATLGLAAGVLAGRLAGARTGRATVAAGAAVWVGLLGVEAGRRPAPVRPADVPAALLAAVVDVTFDAGAMAEAVRRGRPRLMLGRFAYQMPGEFVRRPSGAPRRDPVMPAAGPSQSGSDT